MPVKLISGKDCVIKNAAVIAAFGKRFLLMTGQHGAQKSGALSDVTAALEQQQCSYRIFNEITANPLLSACQKAAEAAKEMRADCIIAIGGGSVLDCAKAAAVFATNRFEQAEDIYQKRDCRMPLPLIVIGTTAGTGSEVSPTAVITVDSTMEKRSITGENCFARLALCDAKYTYALEQDITISTALDAFAHATEGWFSKKMNTTVEIYARFCLPSIFEILKQLAVGQTLTKTQRNTMYYCSVYAGMILCIGTTFPHMLGYTLTDKKGVPHGQACAVFDRYLIEWCAENAPERAAAFFELLHADKDEVLAVLDQLISIPAQVRFTADEIRQYSSKWAKDSPKFRNVCGNFQKKDALALFTSLFEKQS